MKNINFTNRTKISYIFLRIGAKLTKLNKRSRYYKPLPEAEIHMINSIKEDKGIHITGMAGILEVTKGTASQILIKLGNKQMISKSSNSSEPLQTYIEALCQRGDHLSAT